MSEDLYRVILMEDHPIFSRAVKGVLERSIPNLLVTALTTLAEVDYYVRRETAPDLVLLDLHMPNVIGIDALIFVRKCCPETSIYILSGDENRTTIEHCLNNGADAFMKKSYPVEKLASIVKAKLVDNIDPPRVGTGEASKQQSSFDFEEMVAILTRRELLALMYIKQGISNQKIADEMSITVHTVKAHTSHILKKLNMHSRSEIIALANKYSEKLDSLYSDIDTSS